MFAILDYSSALEYSIIIQILYIIIIIISAMWLSQEILVHDNRCRGNTISFNMISKTVL